MGKAKNYPTSKCKPPPPPPGTGAPPSGGCPPPSPASPSPAPGCPPPASPEIHVWDRTRKPEIHETVTGGVVFPTHLKHSRADVLAAYFLLVPFFAAQKARRRYKEPNKAHTHRSSSKIIYRDTSRRRVSTGVKNSRCTHFVQCCATQSCKPETQIVLNSSSCILNSDPTTRWRTEEITHASMRAHWFS